MIDPNIQIQISDQLKIFRREVISTIKSEVYNKEHQFYMNLNTEINNIKFDLKRLKDTVRDLAQVSAKTKKSPYTKPRAESVPTNPAHPRIPMNKSSSQTHINNNNQSSLFDINQNQSIVKDYKTNTSKKQVKNSTKELAIKEQEPITKPRPMVRIKKHSSQPSKVLYSKYSNLNNSTGHYQISSPEAIVQDKKRVHTSTGVEAGSKVQKDTLLSKNDSTHSVTANMNLNSSLQLERSASEHKGTQALQIQSTQHTQVEPMVKDEKHTQVQGIETKGTQALELFEKETQAIHKVNYNDNITQENSIKQKVKQSDLEKFEQTNSVKKKKNSKDEREKERRDKSEEKHTQVTPLARDAKNTQAFGIESIGTQAIESNDQQTQAIHKINQEEKITYENSNKQKVKQSDLEKFEQTNSLRKKKNSKDEREKERLNNSAEKQIQYQWHESKGTQALPSQDQQTQAQYKLSENNGLAFENQQLVKIKSNLMDQFDYNQSHVKEKIKKYSNKSIDMPTTYITEVNNDQYLLDYLVFMQWGSNSISQYDYANKLINNYNIGNGFNQFSTQCEDQKEGAIQVLGGCTDPQGINQCRDFIKIENFQDITQLPEYPLNISQNAMIFIKPEHTYSLREQLNTFFNKKIGNQGVILASGGKSDSMVQKTCYLQDIENLTWIKIHSMNENRECHSILQDFKSKIYAIGGCNDHSSTATIEFLDLRDRSSEGWVILDMNLPYPLYSFCTFQLKREWYLFGGKKSVTGSTDNNLIHIDLENKICKLINLEIDKDCFKKDQGKDKLSEDNFKIGSVKDAYIFNEFDSKLHLLTWRSKRKRVYMCLDCVNWKLSKIVNLQNNEN